MDDITSNDALRRIYIQRLMEEQEPFNIGNIGKDVSSAQGVGNKIMTGLSDALQYLHTGEGNRLLSGITKSPWTSAYLAREGSAKIPQEQATEQARRQREMEKTKSIGDILAQQENIKNEIEIAKIAAGAKAAEKESMRTEKENLKQQADEEDRINKLNKMLSEGEITKEEYDKHASEGTLPILAPSNPSLEKLPFFGKLFKGKKEVGKIDKKTKNFEILEVK